MAKTGLLLLVLLFLYPISLSIIPSISTKNFLAALGIVTLLAYSIPSIKNRTLVITKRSLIVIKLTFIFMAIIAISLFYNSTNDASLINASMAFLSSLLSTCFIFTYIRFFNIKLTEYSLVSYIIYAIFLQALISIILFLSPTLNSLIYSIIYLPERSSDIAAQLAGIRVVGFGKTFFSAGIYSGLGLILIAYLIRYYSLERKVIIRFSCIFLIIFMIGLMMSRTTLIGAVIALLVIVAPSNPRYISSKLLIFTCLTFTLPVILIALTIVLFPSLYTNNKELINFAFELFINYFQEGELSTASTNHMAQMYIFPDNMKTWIIGDGLWLDGDSYYMHTDIGYSRILFYIGAVGLLSYFSLQYYIIQHSFKQKVMIFSIILYLLVLNLKGYTDLSNLLVLLFLLPKNKAAYQAIKN